MIQRKLNDKISPVIKCTPTVHTFSAAIFTMLVPLLGVCIMHTPRLILKIFFVYAITCLMYSIIQWMKLIINK